MLELIESRMGIISILNEECVRPKGSDEAFCQKLITTYHKKNEHFDRPKFSQIQVPKSRSTIGWLDLAHHSPRPWPPHDRSSRFVTTRVRYATRRRVLWTRTRTRYKSTSPSACWFPPTLWSPRASQVWLASAEGAVRLHICVRSTADAFPFVCSRDRTLRVRLANSPCHTRHAPIRRS